MMVIRVAVMMMAIEKIKKKRGKARKIKLIKYRIKKKKK